MERRHFSVESKPLSGGGTPADHDRLGRNQLSGSATLELEVLTPVHVGSGAYELGRSAGLVKAQIVRNGEPIIPGSSIKGMCRSIHEAVTGSPSPPQEGMIRLDRPGQCGWSAALFGGFGYQGRISFDDAVVAESEEAFELAEEEIAPGYPPPKIDKRSPERRFYGPGRVETQQFVPVEAISKGSRLRTQLRFRNVQAYELGSVFVALGIGRFAPKLGGGKYDGLGQVRFHVRGLRLVRPGRWRRWKSARAENYELPMDQDDGDFVGDAMKEFLGFRHHGHVLKALETHLGGNKETS